MKYRIAMWAGAGFVIAGFLGAFLLSQRFHPRMNEYGMSGLSSA
jgi:hypothetical protein